MNETMLSEKVKNAEPDGEISLVGMVVEINPKDKEHRLPLDSKDWRFVLLGNILQRDGELSSPQERRGSLLRYAKASGFSQMS